MQVPRYQRLLGLILLLGLGGSTIGCGSGPQDPGSEGKTTKDIIRQDYQQKKAAAVEKANATKGSLGKTGKPRSNARP